MSSRLIEIFEDTELVEKIKKRLPYFFELAELECSRAGKVGMQVGSVRESVIIALLMYKFGEQNVEADIGITEPEVDVRLFGEPVSIKTIKSKGFGGVKSSWTVDAKKADEFVSSYTPMCDMLFIRINWDGYGGFHYIPLEVQRRVLATIGARNYLKLPKPGTNPRGIEFTKEVLSNLVSDKGSRSIEINWQKVKVDFNSYKRWIDLWRE